MAVKHTPGPLIISRHRRTDGRLGAPQYISDGAGRVVVEFEAYGSIVGNEREANARLLVEAPDLFDALVNASFAMSRAGAYADTNHPLRQAWEEARAVIARIEGVKKSRPGHR